MKISDQHVLTLRHRLADNTAVAFTGNADKILLDSAKTDFREAAVLVTVTEHQGELALVLTRRAAHLNLHPGEAAFPGGKRDQDDSSLLATALREANEEVGLDNKQFEYLGELDQHLTRSNIKVAPYVGLIPENAKLTPNFSELDCIYKVPLDFFANRKNMLIEQVEYHGLMRSVPRFHVANSDYGEQVVWGVTALIIVDLMNTVFDSGLELPEFDHPHY